MARDDDDAEDDRPRKKKRSQEDEEDDDEAVSEKPLSKTKSRDEDDDEEEDDRPRKKKRSRDDEDEDDEEEDDDRSSKKKKKKKKAAMPGMLLAAGIVATAWGGLTLLSSCTLSGYSMNQWNNLRNIERVMPGMGQLVQAFGGPNQGYFITLAIVHLLILFLALALAAGGILLLLRNGIGKFLVMGAPVGILAVALIGSVVTLIVTKFSFFWEAGFVGLPGTMFFTFLVGGFLFFAMFNNDVNRALR